MSIIVNKVSKLSVLIVPVLLCLLQGCAVHPTDVGFSQKTWDGFSSERQDDLTGKYKNVKQLRLDWLAQAKNNSAIKSTVNVRINSGRVYFPPNFSRLTRFKPIDFSITNDRCIEEPVYSMTGNLVTKLSACYVANILYLDSSRYDSAEYRGSVLFYYSSVWLNKFTYNNVNSKGYVGLDSVAVQLQQKSTLMSNAKIKVTDPNQSTKKT